MNLLRAVVENVAAAQDLVGCALLLHCVQESKCGGVGLNAMKLSSVASSAIKYAVFKYCQ